MEDVKEVYLELPWTVVNRCNGFGLDFGGSACKVVYLHKDDWVDPDKRTQSTVSLRCVSFSRKSRTEVANALEYLKERVCIRRNSSDDIPTVFTTGILVRHFTKEIEDAFCIRIVIRSEFECYILAFHSLLRNKARGELVHELDQDLIKKGVNNIQEQIKAAARLMKDAQNLEMSDLDLSSISFPMEAPFEHDKKFSDYENIFPCIYVVIGSHGGIFVVQEDGTYSLAAETKRAGRLFLGLASLLTRSKSFAEIMWKAERGGTRNVHEYISDMTANIDTSGDNLYSQMAKEEDSYIGQQPVFLFGKTIFKEIEEFDSEDLARSFLSVMVSDLVQAVHTAAILFPQVKHVFFSGGFPDHRLTRDLIVEEWLRRDGISISYLKKTEFANIHFLKHGSHLTALGAYLNQNVKFKEVHEAETNSK